MTERCITPLSRCNWTLVPHRASVIRKYRQYHRLIVRVLPLCCDGSGSIHRRVLPMKHEFGGGRRAEMVG